jgi:hypothetical protein
MAKIPFIATKIPFIATKIPFRATKIFYKTMVILFQIRQTAIDPTKIVHDAISTGVELDLADGITLAWEKAVAEVMLNHTSDNYTVLANVARR